MMFRETIAYKDWKLNRGQLQMLRTGGFCGTLAVAGSGKTTALVSQMIFLIAETGRWDLSSLIIVTFTTKAGAELRHRIHTALEAELRHASATGSRELEELWRKAIDSLPMAIIGTIDSLVGNLLRKLALNGNIHLDPGFKVMSTFQTDEIIEEAWDSLEDLLREDSPSVEHAGVLAAVKGLLGAGLKLTTLRGYCTSLFGSKGPGPKAVRALEAFLALEDADKNQVLVGMVGPWRRGIGAFFNAGLRGEIEGVIRELKLVKAGGDSKDEVLSGLSDWLGLDPESPDEVKLRMLVRALFTKEGSPKKRGLEKQGSPYSPIMREITTQMGQVFPSFIREIKVDFTQPATELEGETRRIYAALLVVFRWMEVRLGTLAGKRSLISFDGAARMLLDFLVTREGAIETLSGLGFRPEKLFLDEAQDVNQDQFKLLCSIVGAKADDPSTWESFFVVGDPEQSIYRFRGAQPDFLGWMLEMRAKLGQPEQKTWYDAELEKNGTRDKAMFSTEPERRGICRLETNNRSKSKLLEWIDRASGQAAAECALPYPHNQLVPATEEKSPPQTRATILHPDRTPADGPWGLMPLFNQLAAELIKAKDELGLEWQDFLILAPGLKKQTGQIRKAFSAAGIKTRFAGNWPMLSTRTAKDIMVLLQCLSDPENSMALYGVLRGPVCRLTDEEITLVSVSAKTEASRANNLRAGLWHLAKNRQPASREARAIWDKIPENTRRWILQVADWLGFGPASWRRLIDRMPVEEMLHDILDASGAWDALEKSDPGHGVADAWEALELAGFFSTNGMNCAGIAREFLRHADQNESIHFEAEAEPDLESLRVMTLHSAKGLQAKVVVMLCLDQEPPPNSLVFLRSDHFIEGAPLGGEKLRSLDYLPLLVAKDFLDGLGEANSLRGMAELVEGYREAQEKSRLFHVGLTRAEERLFLVLEKPLGPGPGLVHTMANGALDICKKSGIDTKLVQVDIPEDSKPAGFGPCPGPYKASDTTGPLPALSDRLLMVREARIGVTSLLPILAALDSGDGEKARQAQKVLAMLGEGVAPTVGKMTPGIKGIDGEDEARFGKLIGTSVHRMFEMRHALDGLDGVERKKSIERLVAHAVEKARSDEMLLHFSQERITEVASKADLIVAKHGKPGSNLFNLLEQRGTSEVDFTIRIGRWVISGRIDRLLENGEAIDWKTDQGRKKEIEGKYRPQMLVYSLAMLQRRRQMGQHGSEPVIIHLAMTKGNGDIVPMIYQVAEIEAFHEKLSGILGETRKLPE